MTRILYIDDDEMMQKIYKARLEADGCEVVAAKSGVEGITAITEGGFDFILIDHVLPDMTGVDVLHAIKEKAILGGAIPVMLTASGQERDAEEALAAGAAAFYSKDKVSPRDMLGELLRLKEQKNNNPSAVI